MVDSLPPEFDGDIIFELPALGKQALASRAGQMQGMDKRDDGHNWTRTATSHI